MFKFLRARKPVEAVADIPDTRRILVAEDDMLSQLVTSQMLENEGFQVQVASNGQTVLKLLESIDFDLVIMDCSMPGMDGFTTTKAIRSEITPIRNPQIPIIALTAMAMAGDRQKCLAAGMNEYLSKPVDSVELIGMVEKCLTNQHQSPPDQPSIQVPSVSEPYERQEESFESSIDPGTIEMIVDLFTREIPQHISALKNALKEKDYDALQEVSHKLRGSAAVIDARNLSETAFTLNKAMRFGHYSEAGAYTEDLIRQLESFSRTESK